MHIQVDVVKCKCIRGGGGSGGGGRGAELENLWEPVAERPWWSFFLLLLLLLKEHSAVNHGRDSEANVISVPAYTCNPEPFMKETLGSSITPSHVSSTADAL